MVMSLRRVGMIGKYLAIGGVSGSVLSAVWFTGMTFSKLSEGASSEQAAEVSSLVKRDILVSQSLIGIAIAGFAAWAIASGILLYRGRRDQEGA